MRIAMIGTRGVPARHGGFETAVEEIGARMASAGHEVTVYARKRTDKVLEYRGMKVVDLPALPARGVETLSHCLLSALHQQVRPADVAFVFNAANSPILSLLRLRGIPTAINVDGLEWKRGKWGRFASGYYRMSERLAARWSTAVIADAHGIRDYYRTTRGVDAEYIPYGARVLESVDESKLDQLGLEVDRYHLAVARFEPENNLEMIVEGYRSSSARLPLVVVGGSLDSPTGRRLAASAAGVNVRLVGPVWDQTLLDELYANARTYLHGHSVGGTNPSLLRAMGAGAPVHAFDVCFNREVLVDTGRYFTDPQQLASLVDGSEATLEDDRGHAGRMRVKESYDWGAVADDYLALAFRLSKG